MKPIYSRIVATGGYLPERILSNRDLEQMVETSDAWIFARTGIRSRHIAAPGEKTVDMAEAAARQALADAGLNAADLDLIIVATTTPDQLFPSTACLLQARLGNRGGASLRHPGGLHRLHLCAGNRRSFHAQRWG